LPGRIRKFLAVVLTASAVLSLPMLLELLKPGVQLLVGEGEVTRPIVRQLYATSLILGFLAAVISLSYLISEITRPSLLGWSMIVIGLAVLWAVLPGYQSGASQGRQSVLWQLAWCSSVAVLSVVLWRGRRDKANWEAYLPFALKFGYVGISFAVIFSGNSAAYANTYLVHVPKFVCAATIVFFAIIRVQHARLAGFKWLLSGVSCALLAVTLWSGIRAGALGMPVGYSDYPEAFASYMLMYAASRIALVVLALWLSYKTIFPSASTLRGVAT